MTQEQQIKSLKLEKKSLKLRIEIINTALKNFEEEINSPMHKYQTAEGIKNSAVLEAYKYMGLVPIESTPEKILVLFFDTEENIKELKYFNNEDEASHYADVNYYPKYIIAQ